MNARACAVIIAAILSVLAICGWARADDLSSRARADFFRQVQNAIMAMPARPQVVTKNCCGWGDAMLVKPVGSMAGGGFLVEVVDPLRQSLYKLGDRIPVAPQHFVRGWQVYGETIERPLANPFAHDVLFANAQGAICWIAATRY